MPARRGQLLAGRARSALVALAATALASTALIGAGGGALAGPPPVPGAPVFGRIDPATIDPAFRPAIAQGDRDVTVILQLAGTPVALVQATAIQRGVALSTDDRESVRRALRIRQDALHPAIAKAGAMVLGQYQDAYNGIKVRVAARALTTLAALPGVTRLAAVPIYHLQNATSETYTGVPKAWSQGTGLTGTGVKIAIIDSGIDYYHADFGGSGDPADFKADDGLTIGTPAFPNAKVVGGFDFVGDNYDPDPLSGGSPIPSPDPDPLDCEGHGTHVAGTAAGLGVTSDGKTYRGPYTAAALAKNTFNVPPGAAPGAQLYALKVFGCVGSTDALLDAINWAVQNRMDVINMSVGGTFGTADSPDAIAVDNAVKAGVVVVAAAGNEGPGAYTASTPSVAAGAISVGAVDAIRTFPGATIALSTGDVAAINANGAAGFPVTGPLRVLPGGSGGIGLGCQESDYQDVKAGDIVVTLRGVCPRVDRATLGAAAGAAAVVMVNSADTDLPPFEGTIPDVTIPFLGTRASDGPALQAANGQTVTISGGPTLDNPEFGRATDFTSSGPTFGSSSLKPDVMAPGVSVLSAASGTGTGGIHQTGTSMSSPLVAGIAALVRQAHPAWGPLQVKAAIMSTAADAIFGYDPRLDGSGLIQAGSAVDTLAYATSGTGASLSFGAVALRAAYSAARPITLTNTGSTPITYSLSSAFVGSRLGARMTISPARVTVPAHASARVTATLSLSAASVAALPGIDSPSDAHADLTAIRGAIVATPTKRGAGLHALRVPFLLVPRGLSNVVVTQPTVTLDPNATGDRLTATATVRNSGVHAGSADVFAWGIRSGSIGGTSADVRAVGVQSLRTGLDGRPLPLDVRMLVFAVNTYRPWSTAAINEFDILIDADGTGQNIYVLSAVDHGVATNGAPDGVPMCLLVRLSDLAVLDAVYAKAPPNSATLRCAVLTSTLVPMEPGQPFTYLAAATSGELPIGGILTGHGQFDPFEPAISQGDRVDLKPGQTATIDLSVDQARFANTPALGWMIVSADNASGPDQATTIPAVVPSSEGPPVVVPSPSPAVVPSPSP